MAGKVTPSTTEPEMVEQAIVVGATVITSELKPEAHEYVGIETLGVLVMVENEAEPVILVVEMLEETIAELIVLVAEILELVIVTLEKLETDVGAKEEPTLDETVEDSQALTVRTVPV